MDVRGSGFTTQSPKQGNDAGGRRDILVNGSLASALVLVSDVCALSPLIPDETQEPFYHLKRGLSLFGLHKRSRPVSKDLKEDTNPLNSYCTRSAVAHECLEFPLCKKNHHKNKT